MSNLNKIKTFIKNNYYKLILIFMYVLYVGLFSFQILKSGNKSKSTILYFIIVLLLTTISYIFLIRKVLVKKEWHKIFFWVSILLGSIYLIFIPAIYGTDELPHFLRIYQLSNGELVVPHEKLKDSKIPKELDKFSEFGTGIRSKITYSNFFKKVDYNDKVVINSIVCTQYPLTHYIPQVIGMLLAKTLDLSPYLTLYLIRFFNLLFWTLIMTLAIKYFPVHKAAMTIFFTSPAVLSLVSTCNMDAFPLALIILLFSIIFKYKKSNDLINKKDLFLIIISCLLFCTYKLFYIILLSFLFFIPYKSFKTKKNKNIFIIVLLLISLGVDLMWHYGFSSSGIVSANSEISAQIDFIINNPLQYCYVLFNTYAGDFYYYFSNLFAGSEMCYSNASINSLLIVTYMILFIYIYYRNDTNNIKISLFEKGYIVIISIVLLVLVATSMYISWTPSFKGIGSQTAVGIQSRYFFVLIPLIMLLFKTKKQKLSNEIYTLMLLLNCILVLNTITSLIS